MYVCNFINFASISHSYVIPCLLFWWINSKCMLKYYLKVTFCDLFIHQPETYMNRNRHIALFKYYFNKLVGMCACLCQRVCNLCWCVCVCMQIIFFIMETFRCRMFCNLKVSGSIPVLRQICDFYKESDCSFAIEK